MKRKARVALVRCNSYEREEVQKSIDKAIDLLGGIEEIFLGGESFGEIGKADRIILKPNLLAKADPEKAVTTHPEVFRAVARALKDKGYDNLVYGDSPGNPAISPLRTAEGCGIKAVADEVGVAHGIFDKGMEVEFPEGRSTKSFVLCKEIGENLDRGAIVNICKMKTHQLERITGAVKNTFGCVYGVNKTASHALFANALNFARMLADLNLLVRPRLHIMDGVVAMEGNGPGSGDPVKMGLILASTDPVALDTVFCRLIHLAPELVHTNAVSVEAGIGVMDENCIEIVVGRAPMEKDGTVMMLDIAAKNFGREDFDVQRSSEYAGNFRIMQMLGGLVDRKPIVDRDKCIGCGICEEACPVDRKAVFVIDGKATYNYKKCIKCYCCQEMCPEKAITVKRNWLTRLADRRWRI